MRFIPDVLTGMRVISAGLMGGLIVAHSWKLATLFLLLAILTDAIDGEIARSLNLKTDHGEFFDQFADGMLWLALFISLTLADKLPWWGLAILLLGSLTFQLSNLIPKKSRLWLVKRHAHWMHPIVYALTLTIGLVWLTWLAVSSSWAITIYFTYAALIIILIEMKRSRINQFLAGP